MRGTCMAFVHGPVYSNGMCVDMQLPDFLLL